MTNRIPQYNMTSHEGIGEERRGEKRRGDRHRESKSKTRKGTVKTAKRESEREGADGERERGVRVLSKQTLPTVIPSAVISDDHGPGGIERPYNLIRYKCSTDKCNQPYRRAQRCISTTAAVAGDQTKNKPKKEKHHEYRRQRTNTDRESRHRHGR